MLQGLTDVVLSFIAHYGLLAVFVYLVLETSLLLHFVPSELVIPVAASQLVTDPLSFLVFIAVTTSGATLGAFIPYIVCATFGRDAIGRYGRFVHISLGDLDRGDRWFERWGESSVFWGRLLPLLRAFVSVPAGLAEMNRHRFVVYTAAGSLIYNTALTYAIYAGFRAGGSLAPVIQSVVAALTLDLVYIRTHLLLVGIETALVLAVGWLVWTNRERIRAHPLAAKRRVLRTVRVIGVVVGLLFLTSAVSVPDQAFALITWAWNDPLFFVATGLSERLALVLTGLAIISVTLLGTAVVWRLPLSKIYRTVDRIFRD